MRNKKKIFNLLLFIILPQIAGAIGAFFTIPAIKEWYGALQKPSFSPPNFVFAPVWTILYFLMGVASYLIFEKGENRGEVRRVLEIYFIHLFLNTLWSILFFGLKSPLLGFLAILVLWVFVLFLTVNFYRINRTSGILFYFYFLWVSFASLLNFAIVILNY